MIKRILLNEVIKRRHLFLTLFSVFFALVFTTQIAKADSYEFFGKFVLITQNVDVFVMFLVFGSHQKFGFFYKSKKLFIPFVYQTIAYLTIVLFFVVSLTLIFGIILGGVKNLIVVLFLCFGKAFSMEIMRPLFRFSLKEKYYFSLELSYIFLAGLSKNIVFVFTQNLELFLFYTCLIEFIFFLVMLVLIYKKIIVKFSFPSLEYFFKGYQLMINNFGSYLWKSILNNLLSNFIGSAHFGQYSIISRINDVGGNIRKVRFDIWIKSALINFDNSVVQKIKYQLNFGIEIFVLYILGLLYMKYINIPNYFESSVILSMLLLSHFIWNFYYFEYIKINKDSNFKLVLKIGIFSKIVLVPFLVLIPLVGTYIYPILNFFEIIIILLIIKFNKTDE